MIPRYTPDDFASSGRPSESFAVWLEVELAACEAMEEARLVPPGTARHSRPEARLVPARIDEIERTVKHDVIAFLTHVEELAGIEARWLHRGMTSSDVLDSSLAILLRDAADLLLARTDSLLAALAKPRARAREDADDRAQPRHLRGARHVRPRARRASRGDRARPVRLERARREIARRQDRRRRRDLRAPVTRDRGTALASLGLRAGDREHAGRLARSARVLLRGAGAPRRGIERLATNVRHWQRSEVAEAEEAFTVGQKGSSAMPHKRNPILSENLCGLARIVRAAVVPALEDVALWHERDISHSSVERMIAPDATATLGFMLERAASLVDGLVVYPARLKANLDKRRRALLLGGGAARARRGGHASPGGVRARAAQRDARLVGRRHVPREPRERRRRRARLGAGKLATCFDLDHALAHVPGIVARAIGGE
jgi:adenylosuccinate lyase